MTHPQFGRHFILNIGSPTANKNGIILHHVERKLRLIIPVCIVVIEHSAEHNGRKAYRCSICGYTVTKFAWSKAHARIHTGEKPFECISCGKKFRWKNNYKRHVMDVCGKLKDGKVPSASADKGAKHKTIPFDGKKIQLKTKFKCNICGQEFSEKKTCKWHLDFCSANWKTKKDLEEFLNPGVSWQCNFCGDKFDNDEVYLHHSANCSEMPNDFEKIPLLKTDLFSCKLCGKLCENKEVLVKHTEYCNSNSKTRKIVQNLLELKEKTFDCYFCLEKFANEVECRNHLASCSQISAKVRTFKCELCDREFINAGRLKRHSNYCKKNFKTQKIVEVLKEKA